MGSKSKPARKFIKDKRKNACPACLDREERWVGLPEHENFKRGVDFLRPCEMCGSWSNGTVTEHFPVGNEWRRYPWQIVA